jgi:hypothetical protein
VFVIRRWESGRPRRGVFCGVGIYVWYERGLIQSLSNNSLVHLLADGSHARVVNTVRQPA